MEPLNTKPKLGDFGLAMATSGEGDDGLIFGTPGYAAPEVYEGKPDVRSDVYAAAVILYQLITGIIPESDYQHPSALSSCDSCFDNLLAKALQPDTEHRFQSAEEFAQELEAVTQAPSVPVVSVTPSPARPVTPLRSAKKGGDGLLLATLLIVLFAVGGGLFYLNSNKEKAPDEEASTSEEPLLSEENKPEQDKDKEKEAPQGIPKQEKAAITEPAEIIQPPEKKNEEQKIASMEEEELPTEQSKESTDEPEEALPVSTFDHLAFLTRGRNFFTEKAKKTIVEHQSNLIKNIERLEREGKSILRNEEYITREDERARKANLEAIIQGYQDTGHLPTNLNESTPEAFYNLTSQDSLVDKAIRDALEEQAKVNLQLETELRPLSSSYAEGIRKQVATLQKEGNDYDAEILEGEAQLAQTSFPYFLKIVKGENPNPPSLTAESSQMNLAELITGQWKMKHTNVTFNISNCLLYTSPSPRDRG